MQQTTFYYSKLIKSLHSPQTFMLYAISLPHCYLSFLKLIFYSIERFIFTETRRINWILSTLRLRECSPGWSYYQYLAEMRFLFSVINAHLYLGKPTFFYNFPRRCYSARALHFQLYIICLLGFIELIVTNWVKGCRNTLHFPPFYSGH